MRIWMIPSRPSWKKSLPREMEVIKRDDRLETIAKDIVYHFSNSADIWAKGLVISVDKFTAVKMYDKVQYHWKAEIKDPARTH